MTPQWDLASFSLPVLFFSCSVAQFAPVWLHHSIKKYCTSTQVLSSHLSPNETALATPTLNKVFYAFQIMIFA